MLVNVGRDDAIDTYALLDALDAQAPTGAALDITSPEPLPAEHALFGRRDVLIQSHLVRSSTGSARSTCSRRTWRGGDGRGGAEASRL
jgi:phosphoglycerate dehydrogenase-like enzyme